MTIKPILPTNWDPKQAADYVIEGLTKVTASYVRGAHDAEFVIIKDKAYIVYECNDIQSGENAKWPFIYCGLSIVDLKTFEIETIINFAASEMSYDNEVLPAGACFVPRIIQKDEHTLRCFFASENPGERQSQTWYIDYDLNQMMFNRRIYKVKLKTSHGVFDMEPQHFYRHAVSKGFTRMELDFGLYIFDSFKSWDNQTYVALNNYPIGQNALAVLNHKMDTFEILGDYNEPFDIKLSESAVNRMPDGTWLAITRRDDGDKNYLFTHSKDGEHWSSHESRHLVTQGTNSKPTFDYFNGLYYLGWQEGTTVDGVQRSIFNVEVSKDCIHWERKFRFESVKSFQYPFFQEYQGEIYLAVTQGAKEMIMFGKLE